MRVNLTSYAKNINVLCSYILFIRTTIKVFSTLWSRRSVVRLTDIGHTQEVLQLEIHSPVCLVIAAPSKPISLFFKFNSLVLCLQILFVD